MLLFKCGAVARWRGGAVARWRGGAVVRTSDSQSRESGFKSSCCRLETSVISFTPRCSTLLSCINEYLDIDSGGYVNE